MSGNRTGPIAALFGAINLDPRGGHIGTCLLDNYPHKDTVIEKVKAKAGVEVIEGTHPYRPEQVFGA